MITPKTVIAAAFISLLGTPFLAAGVASVIAHQSGVIQRGILWSLFLFLALLVLGSLLGYSLAGFIHNLTAVCLAWLAYAVLAYSVFRLKPRLLGIPLGLVAVLPVLLGVLLGTVGAFALVFIVGDVAPIYEGITADDRACTVTQFGNETTAHGGYEVVLAERLPGLPIIEQTVSRHQFIDPDFSPQDACTRIENTQAASTVGAAPTDR